MNIDKKDIKALSSDTRVEILRALGDRRKMPSELARELGISPSTVVEHLKLLKKSGMVSDIPTGHKWKYYNLTTKGGNLIKPRFPVQFAILLTLGIILVVGGFYNITTVVDYGFEYPIVTITRTITETITEPASMITSTTGSIDKSLEDGNIVSNETVSNETDYKTDYIPIEQINWSSIIIIVFGSIVAILSVKKIYDLWLK
jgi:DNA-binding transcriptional ArsR family regulator